MPSPPPTPALPLALAGLVALAVAMGIGRFAFTPLLPLMQVDSGLSLAQGGWLASANYLGYLMGALAAGRVAAGPQFLLRSGLAVVVATTALMALPAAFGFWLAVRFAAGVASAFTLVGTAALCLARLGELGHPGLSGVVFSGVGMGIGGAGLICLLIAGAGGGAATGWAALAGLGLAGTVAIWGRLVAVGQGAAAGGGAGPTSAAAGLSPGQRRLVLCYGLLGFGYILPATFLPAQARLMIPDPAVFGWVWPVFGLAAMISTLAVGRLAATRPRRRLWAQAQWVMAAGVLLPALWGHLAALVVAAVCVGGTFLVATLLGLQEARAVAGHAVQRLIAAMTAAFAFGQLAGPLLTTVGGGSTWPLAAAAAGLALSSILLQAPWPHPQPLPENTP